MLEFSAILLSVILVNQATLRDVVSSKHSVFFDTKESGFGLVWQLGISRHPGIPPIASGPFRLIISIHPVTLWQANLRLKNEKLNRFGVKKTKIHHSNPAGFCVKCLLCSKFALGKSDQISLLLQEEVFTKSWLVTLGPSSFFWRCVGYGGILFLRMPLSNSALVICPDIPVKTVITKE